MSLLASERLSFRNWEPTNQDLAMRLWGNPAVMKFIDVRGGLNPDQIKQKLAAEIESRLEFGVQYWPIFESSSGEFVGCCGLKPWLHSQRKGLELGFHLIPEKWGSGLAREAAKAVIGYAARNLPQARLLAGHHPHNVGSEKIILSLGFKFVEDIFFKPTGLMHKSYELGPGYGSP